MNEMISGSPFILASSAFIVPGMQVLLYSVIVFLCLLGILWKFAWGPLMKALSDREDGIAKRISDATATLEAAEARVAEYDRKIANSKEEAAEIIAEGKRDVEKVRDEIQANASAEAEKILERARREIGLAKDAAVQEIRDRMVDLTAELASEVIQREVKPDDHRRLIESAIGQIAETK